MPNHNNRIKYKYAPLENGAFYFPTDEGCNFVVSVAHGEHMLWQSDYLLSHDSIYRIEFESKCDEERHPLDRATCDTILKIISSKIEANGEYCVYYHHWVEDDACDELYVTFYDELESALPNVEAFEFPWMDEMSRPRVLSIFIHKSNPDREQIVQEFRSVVEE